VFLTIRFFLYGDQAATAAARTAEAWQAWIGSRFAALGGASEATPLPS
jgi:hypothetical protein